MNLMCFLSAEITLIAIQFLRARFENKQYARIFLQSEKKLSLSVYYMIMTLSPEVKYLLSGADLTVGSGKGYLP